MSGPTLEDAAAWLKCRVCGCTEQAPCSRPCSWAQEDLCDLCHRAAGALAEWTLGAHRPNRAALAREVEARVNSLFRTMAPRRCAGREAMHD